MPGKFRSTHNVHQILFFPNVSGIHRQKVIGLEVVRLAELGSSFDGIDTVGVAPEWDQYQTVWVYPTRREVFHKTLADANDIHGMAIEKAFEIAGHANSEALSHDAGCERCVRRQVSEQDHVGLPTKKR